MSQLKLKRCCRKDPVFACSKPKCKLRLCINCFGNLKSLYYKTELPYAHTLVLSQEYIVHRDLKKMLGAI